jgi:hypothetical protein
MTHRGRRALGALVLLVFAGLSPARAATDVERLTHLAKLWGAVRYLHPYLAYKEIDWDAALIQAIPKVRSAKTSAEYAAAVQTMLAALGDPVTRVLPPEAVEAAKPEPAADKPLPPLRWLNGQTLVVDLRSYAGYGGFRALFRQLDGMEKEIGKARTVVVDLRPGTAGGGAGFELVLNRLAPFLIHRPLRAPTQRYRLTSGYPSQDGMTAGIYWSGFVTLAAEGFTSATPKGPDRVAFLVSPRTELPAVALALQAAGDGVLVSQEEAAAGALGEESLIVCRSMDLGEGLTAQVRASELVPLPGWPGVHADARIAQGTSDEEAVTAATSAIAALDATRTAPTPADTGTKFVGTPTAGADGEATTFTLPGNIRVGFTGHDVRHADGRQLQGIGLTPDVEVAPTIQGIRDGRDEVLERAVRYLEEAPAPEPSPPAPLPSPPPSLTGRGEKGKKTVRPG